MTARQPFIALLSQPILLFFILVSLLYVQLQKASEISRGASDNGTRVLEAPPMQVPTFRTMKHNRDRPVPDYSYLPNDGAFVHLGKTGGSTLATQLRNGCHSFIPKPCPLFDNSTKEVAASRKIQTYYHVPDFRKIPNQPIPSWLLVSLRDPYDRTRSAFVYSHPRNADAAEGLATHWQNALDLIISEEEKENGNNTSTGTTTTSTKPPMEQLTKCFPTLQAFVDHLGDAQFYRQYSYPEQKLARDLNQTNCRDFTRAVMNHKVPAFSHLYYSMEHLQGMLVDAEGSAVWKPLKKSKRPKDVALLRDLQEERARQWNQTVLFVTRQEHLNADWEKINQLLVGSGDDATPVQESALATTANIPSHLAAPSKKQRDISHVQLPVPNELNDAGRHQLCLALHAEYESYVWFLTRAVNLNKEDVRDAIQRANRNCAELYEDIFRPFLTQR